MPSYLSFFFNVSATSQIYTLSLHDALPISDEGTGVDAHVEEGEGAVAAGIAGRIELAHHHRDRWRSEEHTSELQSRQYLVCRLLLEKKKALRRQRQITAQHGERQPMLKPHR